MPVPIRTFLVIARTDARTAHGPDAAMERALAFRDVGADVVFVESPESEEEMQRIAERLDCPSRRQHGRRRTHADTQPPTADRARLSLWRSIRQPAFLTVGAALERAYGTLKSDGDSGKAARHARRLRAFQPDDRLRGCLGLRQAVRDLT